jgi:glycerophosphoryl diester phosphodiesterase
MWIFLLFGVLGMALPRSGPEIIAHRGSSEEAPENTLLSFRLGFEQADACELDIHLTKDGHVVVIHDADTRRTAGLDRPVALQTLSELKALDAGKYKGEKFAGERIPLLSEVLELIPDRKRLFIEIKCGPEVLPGLVALIRAANKKPEQTALIAFNLETLRQAKLKLPGLEAYWLVASKADPDTGKPPEAAELVQVAKLAGLDGLDLEAAFPIDATLVGKVHAAGLKLYTWTVDDAETAKRQAAAGVDGITTDRPQKLRDHLGR